ncbi:hypothetical protein ACFYUM_34800 [Streptomyces fimicarius]
MIYDNPWVLTRSTRYCPRCLAGDVPYRISTVAHGGGCGVSP